MHIAINYFGQPRTPHIAHNTFTQNIYDSKHTFHTLLTTWDHSNTDKFIKYFPDIYIRKIAKPPTDIFEKFTNYRVGPCQPPHKTLEYYLTGLYIKEKSAETILEYESAKNIKFDIIITIRPDSDIRNNHLSTYYDMIVSESENKLFIANEPKFDIYNTGAYPNCITIGKPKAQLKALDLLSIFEKAFVNPDAFSRRHPSESKDYLYFHPETSEYNHLKLQNLDITILDFESFPWTAHASGASSHSFINT